MRGSFSSGSMMRPEGVVSTEVFSFRSHLSLSDMQHSGLQSAYGSFGSGDLIESAA